MGDVEPRTPARRTRRLQPLADHLAKRLGDFRIGRGKVVIARDLDSMDQSTQDLSIE